MENKETKTMTDSVNKSEVKSDFRPNPVTIRFNFSEVYVPVVVPLEIDTEAEGGFVVVLNEEPYIEEKVTKFFKIKHVRKMQEALKKWFSDEVKDAICEQHRKSMQEIADVYGDEMKKEIMEKIAAEKAKQKEKIEKKEDKDEKADTIADC